MLRVRTLAATAAAMSLAACATPAPTSTVAGDYLSARVAAGVNDIPSAAREYAAAAAARPDQADILHQAFLYRLAAGDIDAAEADARRLVAMPDADGLARLTLAAIELKRGDFASARKSLDGAFAEPFTKSLAYLMRAWIDDETAGPAAAVKTLDAGADELFKGFNPTFSAMFAEHGGDMDAARAAHQLSIGSFGGPVGREAYGAFLERAGDVAAAREFYTLLAKEAGPTRRLARAGLARLEAGVATDAYAHVSAAEGSAMALYLFAGNFLEQTAVELRRASEAGYKIGQPKYDLPLALAQLAVYLDPDFAEARRIAGSIMRAYGENDAARATLAKIGPKSFQYEQAQIDIAAGLSFDKKVDEAIAVLKRAVRLDPDSLEARLTLSTIYASEDRHEEAVAVASEAIARLDAEPAEDAWRYFIARAASLIELKRWPEAEKDLKRAVEISPEEPTTLNYLGYSWAERGQNLEEAFGLIEKAVALQPNSGAIIDSLGWAHYQLGRLSEALPHLEQAAALEPADPTITDHLGDLYWRLDRKVEARFQWERALELDPEADIRAAIEEKLRSGLAAPVPAETDKTPRQE